MVVETRSRATESSSMGVETCSRANESSLQKVICKVLADGENPRDRGVRWAKLPTPSRRNSSLNVSSVSKSKSHSAHQVVVRSCDAVVVEFGSTNGSQQMVLKTQEKNRPPQINTRTMPQAQHQRDLMLGSELGGAKITSVAGKATGASNSPIRTRLSGVLWGSNTFPATHCDARAKKRKHNAGDAGNSGGIEADGAVLKKGKTTQICLEKGDVVKACGEPPNPIVLPSHGLAMMEGGATQTGDIWRLAGTWQRGSWNPAEPKYTFEWEAKCAVQSEMKPYSGEYKGHFWYQGERWQRHMERQLELKFVANVDGGFNISGSGWNDLCAFDIVGLMESNGSFRLVKSPGPSVHGGKHA